ncbi:uncharacterized protein LOC119338938 [Triticum dicoccoides]|uniref:uncharacterized protein LOC119338938 n=1 Tax=Triticum dicoccoides TaxID=85692 RepID=UPI001890F993|nr:uncharacterized protein LOC119338938 [Triticum dicoccoides]
MAYKDRDRMVEEINGRAIKQIDDGRTRGEHVPSKKISSRTCCCPLPSHDHAVGAVLATSPHLAPPLPQILPASHRPRPVPPSARAARPPHPCSKCSGCPIHALPGPPHPLAAQTQAPNLHATDVLETAGSGSRRKMTGATSSDAHFSESPGSWQQATKTQDDGLVYSLVGVEPQFRCLAAQVGRSRGSAHTVVCCWDQHTTIVNLWLLSCMDA